MRAGGYDDDDKSAEAASALPNIYLDLRNAYTRVPANTLSIGLGNPSLATRSRIWRRWLAADVACVSWLGGGRWSIGQIDLDQARSRLPEQSVGARKGSCNLGIRSNHETRRSLDIALALIVWLAATDASARGLSLFRYQDQAQQHCPADTVVWLDFKKRNYYFSGQKL
jgi:hypothetical protein